jgi:hypothetical protein
MKSLSQFLTCSSAYSRPGAREVVIEWLCAVLEVLNGCLHQVAKLLIQKPVLQA